MARQLTTAESNGYKLTATRKQGMPVFRGSVVDENKISVYAALWQPFAEVVFSSERFATLFAEVEKSANESTLLADIMRRLDAEECARYNKPGLKAKAKDMVKNDGAMQKELDRLLKPIVEAVRGSGGLPSSILSAPMLAFLLCLDDEMKIWGGKTAELLQAKFASPVHEAVPEAEKAEARDQLKCLDVELLEVRRSGLAAFIGVRGINFFFKLRHGQEHPVYAVLDIRLATLLLDDPVLDKLINCTKEERGDIEKSARMQMLSMQAEWKKLRMQRGVSERLAGNFQREHEKWKLENPQRLKRMEKEADKKKKKGDKKGEKTSVQAAASSSSAMQPPVSPRSRPVESIDLNSDKSANKAKRRQLLALRFIERWELDTLKDKETSIALVKVVSDLTRDAKTLNSGILRRGCIDALNARIVDETRADYDVLGLRMRLLAEETKLKGTADREEKPDATDE
ncbi:hypothetical protein [Lacisediminimonas profundi]|uniref:hypothetical protein n=1 Tax=Lacisediminimonas profundi TaxID=2603856 RepID=UPI00124B10AA|nr:hypothetical protein [Lacisediminimonas profundi]